MLYSAVAVRFAAPASAVVIGTKRAVDADHRRRARRDVEVGCAGAASTSCSAVSRSASASRAVGCVNSSSSDSARTTGSARAWAARRAAGSTSAARRGRSACTDSAAPACSRRTVGSDEGIDGAVEVGEHRARLVSGGTAGRRRGVEAATAGGAVARSRRRRRRRSAAGPRGGSSAPAAPGAPSGGAAGSVDRNFVDGVVHSVSSFRVRNSCGSRYATTRRISSMEVRPSRAFAQPSWRSVAMPCAIATRPISALDARATARRSMSSVTVMTSCSARRPR